MYLRLLQSKFLVLSIILISESTSASSNPGVDAQLAWGGWTKSGRPTEILVNIYPNTNLSQYHIVTSHANYVRQESVVAPTNYLPSIPISTAIPITKISDTPIEISVRQKGSGTTNLTLAPTLVKTNRRLIINTLAQENFSSIENANVFSTGADKLPQHTAGYGPVDLVISSSQDLAKANESQLAALTTYLKSCRPMILVGANQAWLNAAGCQGKYLLRLTPEADRSTLNATVTSLLSTKAAPNLPNPQALSNLFTDAHWNQQVQILALALAGYLVLLLLARLSAHKIISFALPIVTCAMMILIWQTNRPIQQKQQWSESYSGDSSARSLILVKTLSTRKSGLTLAASDGQGIWKSISPPNSARLTATVEADPQPTNVLSWQAHLLQRSLHFQQTSENYAPLLSLSVSTSRPTITNTADTASRPAVLAWNTKRYSVPSLKPAESWQPHVPENWQDDPAERIFRAQAAREVAALLTELPTKTPGFQHQMMIRP